MTASGRRRRRWSAGGLGVVVQALRFRQRRERCERGVLDLPDPFAGEAEGSADLIERPRLTVVEAEAQLDDAALALRQRGERLPEILALQRERGYVEGRLGQRVFEEVSELRIALFPERLLEREWRLRHAQDLPHLVARQLEFGGDLLRLWLPRELLDELALDPHDL